MPCQTHTQRMESSIQTTHDIKCIILHYDRSLLDQNYIRRSKIHSGILQFFLVLNMPGSSIALHLFTP